MTSRAPLPFERTENRDAIFQRLAGLQIARTEYSPDESGPFGGKCLGMEFVDGTRLVLEFTADLSDGAAAPWIIRPILVQDMNLIWSPTVTKHFTRGRRQAGEQRGGWFQERVEGEVLEHAQMLPEVTQQAGEQAIFVLRNAGVVLFQAMPASHGFSGQFGISLLPKKAWWVDRPLVVPGA